MPMESKKPQTLLKSGRAVFSFMATRGREPEKLTVLTLFLTRNAERQDTSLWEKET